MTDTPATGRTIRQRTHGNPLDPMDGSATMVKPGELVDVIELTPLKLVDRRTYNLLMAHAWDRIYEDVEHRIPKLALRGTHKGNERIVDTIYRLMSAHVEVRVIRDNKRYRQSLHLLETVARPEDEEEDGNVYYRFPAELRAIIQHSNIFARLQVAVMFCFKSKYALALYEMIQKRGNLKSKHDELFTPEELRNLLGVPKGKLSGFDEFRRFAIVPAVEEVNEFSSFRVQIDAIRHGRKVVRLKMLWFPKDQQGLKAAFAAAQHHKAGRKARPSAAKLIAGPEPDDSLTS